MKKEITKQDLINFELEIVKEYKKGETYSPVHLSGGNEDWLIPIFENIKNKDWVFTTHRSHYHSLLKSNDKKWLKKEIIENANSSHINSAKYKIFSSSIVGGIIPIALGTALGIKLKNKSNHVWCFVGDMAAEMGCFEEAFKYALGEELPITFIIENNGLGCNTPTDKVWKIRKYLESFPGVIAYNYERVYPHYGIGEWIIFKDKKLKTKGDYVAEEVK